MTQRYAHLVKGALLTAVEETDVLRKVLLATEKEGQTAASVGGGSSKLRLIKSE